MFTTNTIDQQLKLFLLNNTGKWKLLYAYSSRSATFPWLRRVGTLAAVSHDGVVVPVDLAELRLALVVVVALGSERQLDVTFPVGRVGRLLLADERLAALSVPLADQTAVDAFNTPSRRAHAVAVLPVADHLVAARREPIATIIRLLAVQPTGSTRSEEGWSLVFIQSSRIRDADGNEQRQNQQFHLHLSLTFVAQGG